MNLDAPSLVVDSNYLCHQALYTLGELQYEGVATGVLFGFLSRLLHLGLKFKSNDLILCWDSKHSIRKKIYAQYKAKRHQGETEEEKQKRMEAYQIFTLIRREILPEMGFQNNFIQKGYEADDLIAKIVRGKIGLFVIVSADQDLYQCLQANTRIYQPSKHRIVTRKVFKEEFGIPSSEWERVKELAGCDSDNVPGIQGVGVKTAIKFLTGQLKETSKVYDRITKGKKTISLNHRLCSLPLKEVKEPTIGANSYSFKRMRKVFREYGISSFSHGQGKRDWLRFTKGEFDEN